MNIISLNFLLSQGMLADKVAYIPVLPAAHILSFCAFMQVLQSVQRDAYDNLSHHWQDMAVDTMCALINDNQRMREKCDEFGEHVLRFVENGE